MSKKPQKEEEVQPVDRFTTLGWVLAANSAALLTAIGSGCTCTRCRGRILFNALSQSMVGQSQDAVLVVLEDFATNLNGLIEAVRQDIAAYAALAEEPTANGRPV